MNSSVELNSNARKSNSFLRGVVVCVVATKKGVDSIWLRNAPTARATSASAQTAPRVWVSFDPHPDPQIKSVNPDMNIGSFTFPANDEESDNVLNSGIDLQFSVMKACKNKEAAYEVLKYLYEDETIQIYLDDQGGIACKDGDFAIPETLEDMHSYIENNRMADYQDHHYPSEMSVDAMIQTFLLDTSDNAQEKFLKKFDSDWKRYNRDLIRKVQDYQKEQGDAQ